MTRLTHDTQVELYVASAGSMVGLVTGVHVDFSRLATLLSACLNRFQDLPRVQFELDETFTIVAKVVPNIES